jgi:hypothetical protein
MNIKRALLLGMVTIGSIAASVQAQPKQTVTIKVGSIETAQECTLYEGVRYSNESRASGSSSGYVAASGSGYATPYGGGGSASMSAAQRSSYSASSKTSFETYFVEDCTSRFEGIKAAVEAALASTGASTIGPGGYTLTGRVEDIVPVTDGYVDRAASGRAYGNISNRLKVTMSIKVADRSGKVIFGYPVATEIETDYAGASRGSASASAMSGEVVYSLLQRQLSLAVARKVAFYFKPLIVSQGSQKRIELNYGAPLLDVGSMLTVNGRDSATSARYRVTSVGGNSALAEQIGDADSRDIGIGSVATVIEAGDKAANQSVLERVELP